ncbi:MAG: hypothetical protein WA303_17950 [Bradyrhizobium sp.]|jgi:hypothetical protein
MTFSLSHDFFDLPKNNFSRAAFTFEEAQVANPDFATSIGVH